MDPFAMDFDALQVGERFTTRGRTITESDLVLFAGLTGDRHPQHTDAEWSARGRFGERIAHGMLVLSYAAGLVPFDPERVAALRKVDEATFKHPARIGDTIRVEGEIASKRALDPGHGLVGCRWRVLNQRGKLVVRVAVEAVWRREGVPGDRASEAAIADREPAPQATAADTAVRQPVLL
jgi:3-hydroxybutyryl-CoA dehydratase